MDNSVQVPIPIGKKHIKFTAKIGTQPYSGNLKLVDPVVAALGGGKLRNKRNRSRNRSRSLRRIKRNRSRKRHSSLKRATHK